jgi:hypothetical protein
MRYLVGRKALAMRLDVAAWQYFKCGYLYIFYVMAGSGLRKSDIVLPGLQLCDVSRSWFHFCCRAILTDTVGCQRGIETFGIR